jgi:outer membrane assembly lipoprotein YfgL
VKSTLLKCLVNQKPAAQLNFALTDWSEFWGLSRLCRAFSLSLCVGLLLSSCSTPKVAPLVPKQDLRAVWSTDLGGEVNYPASVALANGRIATATSSGTVSVLNLSNGAVIWKIKIKGVVTAGVGFDGERAAVMTENNDLVVIQEGKIIWQQNLGAQSYTAPLVAGLRVFALLADRSVVAFDGQSGLKLWTQQKTGDALVLKQDGVLAAYNNTLLAGFGSKLAGLDSLTGTILWEAALANPRGINDLERLVDLVGPMARVRDTVCARAFQAQVGCIDASTGKLIWTRPSFGEEGISALENQLVTIESNGQIMSWRVNNGERLWDRAAFKGHHLTAPLVSDKGIFIGDAVGWVYLLSKDDGSVINRMPIGSTRGFASPPTPVDSQHMVIVTKNGSVTQYFTP